MRQDDEITNKLNLHILLDETFKNPKHVCTFQLQCEIGQKVKVSLGTFYVTVAHTLRILIITKFSKKN